jgi:hypothetical protein
VVWYQAPAILIPLGAELSDMGLYLGSVSASIRRAPSRTISSISDGDEAITTARFTWDGGHDLLSNEHDGQPPPSISERRACPGGTRADSRRRGTSRARLARRLGARSDCGPRPHTPQAHPS